ncbi:MAG: hypothetical protein ABGY75_05010, partial [Gemmataceae bacterium]
MLNPFGGRGHSALPPNRKSMADVLNTIGVLGIVLVGGYYLLTFLGKVGGPTKPTASPSAVEPWDAPGSRDAGAAKAGPTTSPDVRLASDRGVEQQALAFAKTRQALAVARADDVARLADECLSEIAAFDATVQPLLGNDDGKKVAGDPVQLARFRAVVEKDRAGKGVAERLRTAATELAAPVRASQANAKDASNPSDLVTTELDRLATQLAGLKRLWEQDRRTVEAVVTDAKRSKRPAATNSLDAAVRADAEAEALDLATATEKERAKVRAEMKEKQVREAGELERKIEEAKLEKLRSTKLAEAGRIQTDAEITTEKGKDAVAAEKAKLERERLLKKIQTPEVKQTLAPLLTPGYHQPFRYKAGALGLERTAKKQPVSLSRLQEAGALEQTIKGLGELADITGSKDDYVRPRLKLPDYTSWWSTAQQEKIQKVQDLLIELGPTLVEEGL